MILDSQEQKQLIIDLVRSSTFQGSAIKKIYEFVCIVEEAKIVKEIENENWDSVVEDEEKQEMDKGCKEEETQYKRINREYLERDEKDKKTYQDYLEKNKKYKPRSETKANTE